MLRRGKDCSFFYLANVSEMELCWGGAANGAVGASPPSETELFRVHNEIWFGCPVSAPAVNRLITLIYEVVQDDAVSAYTKEKKRGIVIHIDSQGGLLRAAFKFVDFVRQMQQQNYAFRSIINGAACSAATLMAAVCDVREITRHSTAMLHELSAAPRSQYTQFVAYGEHLAHVHNLVVAIYLDRGTFPNAAAICNLMQRETWFSAEAYLNTGLVDRII